ncbi:MAG TPA: hypothetical protein VJ803_06235 [Gemmatimonadaceae bacterium]|nr:hypothetical protein [Gemmatimonadaceae bacterium]
MYVVAEHMISDPAAFWSKAEEIVPNLPPQLALHHCLPTKDGSRGICVWEGESVEAVRSFLEGHVARWSKNDYYQVENREAIALPSGVRTPASRQAPNEDRREARA